MENFKVSIEINKINNALALASFMICQMVNIHLL